MGTLIKKYKPKQENVVKLKIYLEKIKNENIKNDTN
jgi:hypothetical protein